MSSLDGRATVEPADHELARAIAGQAGALLAELRRSGLTGKPLGDAGDRASQQLCARALADARPGDAVLSEEAAGRPGAAGRVWVVDPLDGTREFAEQRPDWAVHVALCVDGVPVCGAVALPAEGLVLATDDPPSPVAAAPSSGVRRLVVSRSRPPAWAEPLAAALGAEVVGMGSAGAKAMAVVRGGADLYAHDGGMHDWDVAAPVAVALAAGLHASRIDGSPVTVGAPDAWLPDLLICRPELAGTALAALGDLR